MMPVALATPAVFMLLLWTTCALLTVVVHVGVSLAIDRRFVPGLWEQWALALMMLLGPLGVCLEILLVWKVLQDIRRQIRREFRKGQTENGTAPALFSTGTGLG